MPSEVEKEGNRRRSKAYYWRHHAKIAAERNTPERKAYQKKYYKDNRRRLLDRQKEYNEEHPRHPMKTREYTLMREYGMTLAQYDQMVEDQNGCCKICKLPETTKYKDRVTPLRVDHDWKSGRVRGLLCNRCNTSLGQLRESIPTLENMIEYILEYSDAP